MASKYLDAESVVMNGREVQGVQYAFFEESPEGVLMVCQTNKGRRTAKFSSVTKEGHYILFDSKNYIILKVLEKAAPCV
jgi:hypothetical protein